ncbi:hypothetical protein QJQ45_025889, partial [Haematococcus lacustris]
ADFMQHSHVALRQQGQLHSTLRVHIVQPGVNYCARVADPSSYADVNREVADPNMALHLSGLRPSKLHDNVVPASTVLGNKTTIAAGCVLGEGCTLGDKASIKRSVLGANCRLGANVKVINSVLQDGVVIGDGVTLQNTVCCQGASVKERTSLKDCQRRMLFCFCASAVEEDKHELLDVVKPKDPDPQHPAKEGAETEPCKAAQDGHADEKGKLVIKKPSIAVELDLESDSHTSTCIVTMSHPISQFSPRHDQAVQSVQGPDPPLNRTSSEALSAVHALTSCSEAMPATQAVEAPEQLHEKGTPKAAGRPPSQYSSPFAVEAIAAAAASAITATVESCSSTAGYQHVPEAHSTTPPPPATPHIHSFTPPGLQVSHLAHYPRVTAAEILTGAVSSSPWAASPMGTSSLLPFGSSPTATAATVAALLTGQQSSYWPASPAMPPSTPVQEPCQGSPAAQAVEQGQRAEEGKQDNSSQSSRQPLLFTAAEPSAITPHPVQVPSLHSLDTSQLLSPAELTPRSDQRSVRRASGGTPTSKGSAHGGGCLQGADQHYPNAASPALLLSKDRDGHWSAAAHGQGRQASGATSPSLAPRFHTRSLQPAESQWAPRQPSGQAAREMPPRHREGQPRAGVMFSPVSTSAPRQAPRHSNPYGFQPVLLMSPQAVAQAQGRSGAGGMAGMARSHGAAVGTNSAALRSNSRMSPATGDLGLLRSRVGAAAASGPGRVPAYQVGSHNGSCASARMALSSLMSHRSTASKPGQRDLEVDFRPRWRPAVRVLCFPVSAGASGSGQQVQGQGQAAKVVVAERRQVIKAALRGLVEAALPDLSPAQVDAVVAEVNKRMTMGSKQCCLTAVLCLTLLLQSFLGQPTRGFPTAGPAPGPPPPPDPAYPPYSHPRLATRSSPRTAALAQLPPPVQLDIWDPHLLAQIKNAMELLTKACVIEHMMRGPHHRGTRLLHGEVAVFEQPSSAWPVAMLKELDEVHLTGDGNSLNANATNIITSIKEFYRHPGRFINKWGKAVGVVEEGFSRTMKKHFPQLVLDRLDYSQSDPRHSLEGWQTPQDTCPRPFTMLPMVGVRARHFVIDDRVLHGLLTDLGMTDLTLRQCEADSLPHWQKFIQYSQLHNSGWEFARRKLTATSDYDPTTHIAVGVDPGVTQAIKAGHAQRHPVTAAIQPQLQQLAAATLAGTTLGGLHAHVLALKATWDALWEEYLNPRWRRQRLALHHAQERIIESFCKKSLELKAATVGKGHVADLIEEADKHRRLLGMKKQGSLQDTLPMPCRMRHAVHVCRWLEQWQQPPTPPVPGHPVVAPRKPPQAPRSSQAATPAAASEPGPSTPPPAKRSKRTMAEPAAEPTKGTGKAQGKAAEAKPAPQPGRWLDRDCNAALNMQRIGESRWRPLELCFWPDQGALPAKGKEYPGLGYKRLRDKPPKAQQQQQPAEALQCVPPPSELSSAYN